MVSKWYLENLERDIDATAKRVTWKNQTRVTRSEFYCGAVMRKYDLELTN